MLLVAGCGGASLESYTPEADKARKALEVALDAWKGGAPMKTIDAGDYKINAEDVRWRDGAKLESFEILSDEPSDTHRIFRVRTRVKGKDEESNYVVFGIDPIQVYREKEFVKAGGM